MEGRRESTWKRLKRILTLKTIGCCGCKQRRDGNSLRLTLSDSEEYVEFPYFEERIDRRFDHLDDSMGSAGEASVSTTTKVSLMRLLEEREEKERDEGNHDEGVEEGEGPSCCICMGRKKRAAFIPCGHTFCRTCSRELWSSRRSCPLCNRLIAEILDIF